MQRYRCFAIKRKPRSLQTRKSGSFSPLSLWITVRSAAGPVTGTGIPLLVPHSSRCNSGNTSPTATKSTRQRRISTWRAGSNTDKSQGKLGIASTPRYSIAIVKSIRRGCTWWWWWCVYMGYYRQLGGGCSPGDLGRSLNPTYRRGVHGD